MQSLKPSLLENNMKIVTGGVQLGRFPMFVKHVTGSPTDFFRLENGTEEWTPEGYINSVVIQQIA
jgi:hypothetical protein